MPRRFLFAAIALLLLGSCRRDGREPLTVYSPHGRAQLELLERMFEERHPGIDVRWLDMGSQEILDRLRFERVNPQADVWFGGPATVFARGAKENLLEPMTPSWKDAVDPRAVGPGGLWWPVYRTPAILAWNSRLVSETEAPRDWDDILDPRWTGKVLIRDPMASGTMRAIWGWLVQREIRAGRGEAGGFDWLRRLDRQTKTYVLNPMLLVSRLARGEGLVTLWDLPDILVARAQGLPFGWCFPSSGTVVIDDPVALVRGSRHREAAALWIEFVASPEALAATARENFRSPARTDLPGNLFPDWVSRVDREMTVADVDWELHAREGARWMAAWDREVRGRGN